eukprot:TRINITY_DN2370_c0_g1_i1.p1 TRINITY_DN2370_c0_g1~~TRINITY_DN2370_c0_g1_i1.p1  ORF type:complete len:743 (+),score=154.80 TRINITY_DN2370_c0_g1_i1:1663-3891(+)
MTISELSPMYPGGAIASGGNDKVVHVWNRDKYATGADVSLVPDTTPHVTLEGHEGTVSCLGLTAGGEIISGSWDMSARIWRSEHVQTLKGHSAAVWGVLGLPNGNVLTASADKTIKHWDGDGNCLNTFTGHEDCVRALVSLESLGLVASCSNDGTIRLWSLEGDVVQTLTGHASFVFNLAYNQSSGELVSCGEDNTVKVWRDGECVATIEHPNSVWDVETLPNGDIVSACADGIVRVWTRESARVADQATIESFYAQLEAVAAERRAAKEKKLAQYPSKEDGLKEPGKRNGETKVVRNGNEAEAHMWNAAQRKWEFVGVVVDNPGDDADATTIGGKKILNGKEYDFVFDIDVGDGQPHRKLGYNRGENPYLAAQEFIWNEELNQDYLDQIARFISVNAGVDSNTNTAIPAGGDPLTGGSRYVPGGAGNGGHGGSAGADPFTGGSRYVPRGSSAPAPSVASQPSPSAPVSSAPSLSSSAPFPVQGMSTFEQRKFAPAMGKIKEFQSAGKLSLSDAQYALLEKLTGTLADTSRYHATSVSEDELKLMYQALESWPGECLIPALDIFRQLVLHPSAATYVAAQEQTIARLVELGLSPEAPFAHQLLVIRTLCNMFWSSAVRPSILQNQGRILDGMADFCAHAKANLRLSVASVLLNLAVLYHDHPGSHTDFKLQTLSCLIEILGTEQEGENLLRALKAVGTLIVHDASTRQVACDLDLPDTLADLATSPRGKDVTSVVEQVKALL